MTSQTAFVDAEPLHVGCMAATEEKAINICPHSTRCVAAGALLAAVLMVVLGANDDSAGPSGAIRQLARAREIAERASRTVSLREANRRTNGPVVAGAARDGAATPR